MGDGAMLILEAKDMAADKMSNGEKHHGKKDKDKNVDGDLLGGLKKILSEWEDKKHPYYKDLLKFYTSNGGEVEEEEEY